MAKGGGKRMRGADVLRRARREIAQYERQEQEPYVRTTKTLFEQERERAKIQRKAMEGDCVPPKVGRCLNKIIAELDYLECLITNKPRHISVQMLIAEEIHRLREKISILPLVEQHEQYK